MGAFTDQRGVALPVALIALVALTGLLVVFLSMGSTESMISQGHAVVTEARFVAEAGLEHGYDTLAQSADWNSILLGADGLPGTADDGQVAVTTALPGLAATAGTFTVAVRNDSLPGDTQLTGVAPDPGGAFNDTNGRVIITAAGATGPATRTIQVVVTRINLPPIVGALSLPGNESETTFNGNSFTVKGTDTNMDDTPGTGAAVWGIAVGAGQVANETTVQNSLSAAQKDNVTGKLEGAGPAYGDNTIAQDAALTPDAVQEFITAIRNRADLVFESTPAAPLAFTNIGASCATDPNSQTCWGTRENPKIVYVKGQPDPTSAFAALQVSGGTTGAGILVVEDGDFRISGNFRWDGIVIVTGQFVGIGYMGGGWQTVYGAVISNETATDPGYKEALVSGNAKLNYSSQAVDLARKNRKLFTLTSWRET